MSDLGKLSQDSNVNTLMMTFTVLGFLLFLFSLVLPFYYAKWIAALSATSWSNYYWSYLASMNSLFGAFGAPVSGSHLFWFYDYWSGAYTFTFDTKSVLIPLFVVQLLTLALGLVSIRFSRRTLLFAPVPLGSAVAVLMTYAGEKTSRDVLVISGGYQLGYYLVYPAIAMFLFAFLLNEVTKIEHRQKLK